MLRKRRPLFVLLILELSYNTAYMLIHWFWVTGLFNNEAIYRKTDFVRLPVTSCLNDIFHERVKK